MIGSKYLPNKNNGNIEIESLTAHPEISEMEL